MKNNHLNSTMRYSDFSSPPALPPAAFAEPQMVLSLLAFSVPFVGMGVVFIVYLCLLWYSAEARLDNIPLPVKPAAEKGLSTFELEKWSKCTGKELVMRTECAVCLDEIESEQTARVVPGCNHGFHLECADTWLSKHPVCPVCRAKLC